MSPDEFKAWRIGAGLSQSQAATVLQVTKRTVMRYDLGQSVVPPAIINRMQGKDDAPKPKAKAPPKPASSAPAGPAAIDPRRLARKYDWEGAPAFTKGLKRLPETNLGWGAASYWDTRPASPGFQRIPGCIVVVRESIPDPIPFAAPAWAGEYGVLTASGRVFHSDSGAEMHDIHAPRAAPDFARSGTAKGKAGKAKR